MMTNEEFLSLSSDLKCLSKCSEDANKFNNLICLATTRN